VDVCIIHHKTFDVLEVAAFEPAISVESARIFVRGSTLAHMITEVDLQERIKKLKEPFLRRKEAPDEVRLLLQARNEARADMIVNRLQIGSYNADRRDFSMVLVETACDVEKCRPKLICVKPPGMQEYCWTHTSTVT
jgi:hypothetical protein